MSVTAGVRDSVTIRIRDKLKGKIGQTKVKRYRRGKVPEWADNGGDEEGDNIRMSRSSACLEKTLFPSNRDRDDDDNNNIVKGDDDPRLRRLTKYKLDDNDKADVRANHRRFRQATEIIISTEEEEEKQRRHDERLLDDDEDEKRKRIKDEAKKMILESSSEYETDDDSEEEQIMGIVMVKPVWVPNTKQDTISKLKKIQADETRAREKVEKRKVETKEMVIKEISKDMEIKKNIEETGGGNINIIADVDTDDELNRAEEDKAWKARERARNKREKEERNNLKRAGAPKVRRNIIMSDEEWERNNPMIAGAPKRKRMKFMQKYYHKGAFFQDDDTDGIIFCAPTGEDKMDKTILPMVMQVKNFGRSGRTKWTHLVNEDTTTGIMKYECSSNS